MVAKLRAIGIEPGANPRAAWEALDPAARRTATNIYASRHAGYRGGGAAEVRPTRRARPTPPRRPFAQPIGHGTVYWSTDLGRLGRAIMDADRNAYVLVLARLWGHDVRTNQEGWREWWVGDANKYWRAHPAGPAGERNPVGKVQVSISSRAGRFDVQGRVSEGGFYRAWQYQDAIRAEQRRRGGREPSDPGGLGGALARAIRSIVNEGGF